MYFVTVGVLREVKRILMFSANLLSIPVWATSGADGPRVGLRAHPTDRTEATQYMLCSALEK
jgi:hypothetical protein